MHEAAFTESLLSLALEKAREAGARKIIRVNLVLGELSGVAGDCVRTYFEALAPDTPAAGAALSFEVGPAILKCRGCGLSFPAPDHNWACPRCRGSSVEITSGRECYLESIEVE
jgi:hydrogenase nickel incorporation protein HypA/HybF